MTKKEQAAMQAAIDRARLLGALRWTERIEPDIDIPRYPNATSGWVYNAFTGDVYEAWSESVCHGRGPRRGTSASREGKRLYSSRLRALKAMRHEVERMAAERLAKIDAQIAAEEVA